MAQNTNLREQLSEILSTAQSEREWWDQRRATLQDELLKELDEEKKPEEKKPEEKKVPITDASAPKGSDDEAVLVESGGPADKSVKAKKKKGKH